MDHFLAPVAALYRELRRTEAPYRDNPRWAWLSRHAAQHASWSEILPRLSELPRLSKLPRFSETQKSRG